MSDRTPNVAAEVARREWDGEPVGEPMTIYAIVEGGQFPDAFVIKRTTDGVLRLWNDSDGEYTYAECDYDGLSGLVVFEGMVHTRQAMAAAGYGWPHPDDCDEWFIGKWRQMRADEAVALGLVTTAAEVGE